MKMGHYYLLCLFMSSASVFICGRLVSFAHAQSYEAWQLHRQQMRQDPSVIAYYTFEDIRSEQQTIANERSADYALHFVLVPASNQPPQKLEMAFGRWPQKKAVRLDMGRLEGPEIPVLNKSFTASCWIKALGPGVHRGNSGITNGTILSVGIGYWDGWRIILWYPQRRISFEIGRPKPSSAYSISHEPFMDGIWNHIAAAWDGKEARLYLNGILIARGTYEGEYTAPPQDKHFRIGYANYGVGSALVEIDEAIVRNRALRPMEILQEVFLAEAPPAPIQQIIEEAEEAIVQADYDRALQQYRQLAKDKRLESPWRDFVSLRLGWLYQHQRQMTSAAREYLALATQPHVPLALQSSAKTALMQMCREGMPLELPAEIWEALLNIAALEPLDKFRFHLQYGLALQRQGKMTAAQAEFAKAFSLEAPMREKLNAQLQLAHACRAKGDYEAARNHYLQVVEAAAEYPEFQIAALFGIAEGHAAQKKWDLAAAAYARAAALADAPAHLREEARERQAEIPFRKTGKPLPPRARHVSLPVLPKPALEFHVAVNGNDDNPGTMQKPFASLQAAQAAIRRARLQAGGKLPRGGAVVYIHGGTYRCSDTILALTQEDSGTEEAPIVYRNYREEKVRFTGGVPVQGFQPVMDPAILERLPEDAWGHVLQADLRGQGISDLGKMSPRGMDRGTAPYVEVFWNGEPLRLARWPNEGWLRVGPIVSGGQGSQPTTFGFDYERAARWTKATDVYAEGYWRYDWAEASLAVDKIDVENKQITINKPGGYGIVSGQRYFILNLLEEIDQPGEMYLDRTTGILYVYPPSDPQQAHVEFSLLEKPFITMTDCDWTILQGLTFDICRGNAIEIKNGAHILLAGCTITRPGQTAVIISGGHNCGLFGCDIGWTGRGGAHIIGGDRKTLTPGRHFVENCHIHHFSRIERSYTPAVLLEGCGNRIAHNLMHESPHHALRIEGNDHLVEFNEIHSVVYEGDDQAGLDIWGNPTYWGNVFRYNFWHHIGSGQACGQGGIRLDDMISGVLMYGNIFYKCSEANFGAIQIHGGKDNIADNNLFIYCKFGISFSGWGQARWEQALDSWGKAKIEEVNALQPPYSERYPKLLRIRENADVNCVWRNVAVNCGSFLTRDRGIQELMDNLILAEDPGFIAPQQRNFGLKPTSPVFAQSVFRRIPVEEIGLYPHPWRASWPVTHDISPNYKPLPN